MYPDNTVNELKVKIFLTEFSFKKYIEKRHMKSEFSIKLRNKFIIYWF